MGDEHLSDKHSLWHLSHAVKVVTDKTSHDLWDVPRPISWGHGGCTLLNAICAFSMSNWQGSQDMWTYVLYYHADSVWTRPWVWCLWPALWHLEDHCWPGNKVFAWPHHGLEVRQWMENAHVVRTEIFTKDSHLWRHTEHWQSCQSHWQQVLVQQAQE